MTTHQPALLPDGWPALMSAALAARYLSMDELSFQRFTQRAKLTAVDLGEPLLRWRRADLDQAIKRLPTLMQPQPSLPPTLQLDKQAIDAIVEAITTRLAGQRAAVEHRLCSIREATALLGLSRSTIYRLISEGELAMHKIGGRTLIRKADLDAMMG